jgi:hypothetical protein
MYLENNTYAAREKTLGAARGKKASTHQYFSTYFLGGGATALKRDIEKELG